MKGISVGDIVYPYPRLVKKDRQRAGTIGGFSEYILVEEARMNENIYILPCDIPIKQGALIEPFTVGLRSARRANVQGGENGIVFGAGTIGISAAIGLKYFGCNKVMICDVSDFRLDIARRLGFETCNLRIENLEKKSTAYFGKACSVNGVTYDADIFIDGAGADEILNKFETQGKIGSRIVVVAVNKGMKNINILNLTFSQKSIIGSGGYMQEDVFDVINIMESKKWDIGSLITDEYVLSDISKAIEKAADINKALNVIIKHENS